MQRQTTMGRLMETVISAFFIAVGLSILIMAVSFAALALTDLVREIRKGKQ